MKTYHVLKRNGDLVPFVESKISNAISKAFKANDPERVENSDRLASTVSANLQFKFQHVNVVRIEDVQNMVEETLMDQKYFKAARAYIIYRNNRSAIREKVGGKSIVPLAKESSSCFSNNTMREFVYFRTYSRWIEELGRREFWTETVDRYITFMRNHLSSLPNAQTNQQKGMLSEEMYRKIRNAILKQEVMPSMRLLQFAGPPATRCNTTVYNCAFVAPDCFKDLADLMYILMSGCGVGFTVESANVNKFPVIQLPIPYPSEHNLSEHKLSEHNPSDNKLKADNGREHNPRNDNLRDDNEYYVIEDSKEGWCDAFLYGLERWYSGKDVTFNFDKLRPAGARLKTMGGRSSGPQPLRDLLSFTRHLIQSKAGSKLSTLNFHDIICKIAQIVVAGGVRRSSTISLSDLHDNEMRDCKSGEFWNTNPQRSMANNSAVYDVKPTQVEFMQEWISLAKSGSGERGIFNRGGLKDVLPKRRVTFLGDVISTMGSNPCAEILLQSRQFCNLSEVVCRSDDTVESLTEKIKIATILGTYQASLTDFKYIDFRWKKNQKEEALLGVSLTGQYDCPILQDSEVQHSNVLQYLKSVALQTNEEYAEIFGIRSSMAVTTTKPSGTVSQMVDSSSGIHPRFSPYYIRRIRISATDPLLKLMKDQGYPCQPEVGQTESNASTFVLNFPIKAPDNAICVKDVSALEQLRYWKEVKTKFTEHNPSVTIYVKEDEWLKVGLWVWDNWKYITGLSFLPHSDHIYQLAPYEEITKEQYHELASKVGPVDFSKLIYYEHEDGTDNKRVLACSGMSCEL